MEILENDIFYKFVGQRLPFTAVLADYKKIRSPHYRKAYHRVLIFRNIKWENRLFRNHVHIQVSKGVWNELHNRYPNPFGLTFTFTAEIYRYTKKPDWKRHEIARVQSIGLQDIRKIQRVR
ncbi:hypothetical protein ABPH35_01965 [Streptococcus sp. ZJ93]|uniref:hypothetical protein n=1 Tax=Streptococcus handemini TaxID=3161188 RepID=UPI0034D5EAAA